MAEFKHRGNLLAKVFPFLSSQFGQTVILGSSDHASAFSDGSGGDNNIPQAYYMHNVMPTSQGYKSVGYHSVLKSIEVTFDRVVTIRDPDMVRGWIGITTSGALYLYAAGDTSWTDVSLQVAGWKGGAVSIAYANGYTYLCLSKFNVYKLDVKAKQLIPVNLAGLIVPEVVAITSSANYLIVTDGVKIYWSSTITPEDFVPSQITGAGSGNPTDVEGTIVALVPIGSGFAVYTSVNIVIASYTQNPKYPWLFKGADNSKGISDVQHITYSGDDGTNYAWTSAGLQKITVTGAVTIMPDVTDFLAGKRFEDFDTSTNSFVSQTINSPLKLKLGFIGARYLIISYGVAFPFTHAIVYDTVLKRWGKLKYTHVTCFEITLNSDEYFTTSNSASARKTLGLVSTSGEVVICNFEFETKSNDSVLVLGKFQILRSRLCTLQKVELESIEEEAEFSVVSITTLDGKTTIVSRELSLLNKAPEIREYASRVTGINHSLILKGNFNLNSFEITLTLNGRR
jgi:hypothetical protein